MPLRLDGFRVELRDCQISPFLLPPLGPFLFGFYDGSPDAFVNPLVSVLLQTASIRRLVGDSDVNVTKCDSRRSVLYFLDLAFHARN